MHNIVRKINDNLIVCDMEDFYYNWHDNTTYIDNVITGCVKYSTNNATIVGSMVIESDHYSEWIRRIQEFCNKLKANNRKFLLVTNSWHDIPSQKFEIIYLNYNMVSVWFESVGRKNNVGFKKEWDNTSKKFLFLTGKPNKIQRIRLLYKMFQEGLLKNALWSLFVLTEDVFIKTRAYLPELNDYEYDKFIKEHINSPDKYNIDKKNIDKNASMHFGGTTPNNIPSTMLEIVSESSFSDTVTPVVHISEKIWKTIMNNMPFIVAGDTGYLAALEMKGYKTFKKYMKYPEYNNITNSEDKLNMIVKNIKYWYKDKTYILFESEIRNDIQHNFKKFKVDVQQSLDVLNNLNCKFKLDDYGPYDLISQYQLRRENEWLMFYDSIKDETWPPCVYEDEFRYLPEYIQQECIDTFNYNPNKPLSYSK